LFLFDEPGFAETGRGFAELEPHEKARVSHRGRALRELAARLHECS
jgi:inosine/xanthosine triphosphate pyrophosphatase family protein